MARPRRMHVFRSWENRSPTATRDSVLVEMPGKWAHSVVSLIEASKEYRHSGLIVTNVGPRSQAARVGMVRGDVLLRYGGQDLENVGTLRSLTKAHTQPGIVGKSMTIEAARGADDVEFEVAPGALGITVSPLLHRLSTSTPRRTRTLRRFFGTAATVEKVMPRVVQTVEEARQHNQGDPAFVLVPGELARPVLAILRSLESVGSPKKKRRAKSLLTATRR